MDNNNPPLAHDGHPALHVAEILENVLLSLDLEDVLINAQATSRFWRDCIQGSTKIKRKCFLVADILSEEETDSRLFLGSGLPDLGDSLVAKWSQSRYVSDLGQLAAVTPAILRAFFVENPLKCRYPYRAGIFDYFEQLDDEEANMQLTTNMGREGRDFLDNSVADRRTYESLLDMSRLNPLLRRSWKGRGSATFTGYEKHIISVLDNRINSCPETCEYITHIREFLETIASVMSSDEKRRTWETMQVTSPAVTKVTIGLYLPLGGGRIRTFSRDTGITMLDFADVFIKTVRVALHDYESWCMSLWLRFCLRDKRGGTTWRRLMGLYKKERALIKTLVNRLDGMEDTWSSD
jgi:hypothetical protein